MKQASKTRAANYSVMENEDTNMSSAGEQLEPRKRRMQAGLRDWRTAHQMVTEEGLEGSIFPPMVKAKDFSYLRKL